MAPGKPIFCKYAKVYFRTAARKLTFFLLTSIYGPHRLSGDINNNQQKESLPCFYL